MVTVRKIAVHLPEDLLAKAQWFSGEGITETLRRALESYSISEGSKQMIALRGKAHLHIDIDASREDRTHDAMGNVSVDHGGE
jgi:hypothetical protein